MISKSTWTRRAIIGGAIGTSAVGSVVSGSQRRGLAMFQTPVGSPVATGDRASVLVDAETLAAERERRELRITALTPPETFVAGHIPEVRTIDWPALELTDTTDAAIAAWTEMMKPLVSSVGSGSSFGVAIYDEGSLFACRLWWVLEYLGYGNKVILDGGFPAWQAAGLPVETGEQNPITTPGFEEFALRPEVLAPIAQVEASVGDPGIVFVDARSADEYAQGHIPGAINVEYLSNAAPEPPRFWKSNDELLRMYADAGITPETRVIPYCTTGVRSAVTWFTLRMIGFTDTSLFTGSWAEWSADPDRPVTTGPNP